MNPECIESVSVIGPEKAIKVYGEKAKDGVMDIKPVSYTHLDVYKRQSTNRLVLLSGFWKMTVMLIIIKVSIPKIKAMRADTCLLYTSRCV